MDGLRQFAEAARADFDTFVEFVGVDDAGAAMRQHELHRMIWKFADWAWEQGLSAGVMVPAGHGKTTQCCLRLAWEIGRDLNVLARIVTSGSKKSAERIATTRAFMNRARYRMVFPHVRIVRGEEGDGEFWVARSGVSKDPTLGGSGVTTGTGARTSFLVLDDIVDLRNAILVPAERKRVLTALRDTWMSRPLLRGRERTVWIQTAYHVDDAAAVTQREESGWAWLIVRAEAPYEKLSAEIVVEGRELKRMALQPFADPEALRRKARKMGPVAAARNLANRPWAGDEQAFREHHFQGLRAMALDRYPRRVGYVDPAGDARAARRGDTDWCAMVAIGKHPEGRRWDALRSKRIRGAPQRQAEWVAENAIAWGLHELWVEAVADGAMPALVQEELRRKGCYVPVRRTRPTVGKEVRLTEILEPALTQGLLSIRGEDHPELRDELLSFPIGAHDDLADALAGAYAAVAMRGPVRCYTTARAPAAGLRRFSRRPRERVKLWDGPLA